MHTNDERCITFGDRGFNRGTQTEEVKLYLPVGELFIVTLPTQTPKPCYNASRIQRCRYGTTSHLLSMSQLVRGGSERDGPSLGCPESRSDFAEIAVLLGAHDPQSLSVAAGLRRRGM
jgi:hypothetical protein